MTPSRLASTAFVARRSPRIRIFNVKYSPNLGDGLLSECLEQALIDCGADPDTWSVDLAARTAYGAGTPARALQMQLLDRLPGAVRNLAVRAPLALQGRRRWAPHYARSLEGAECVVVGGGNLIADLDLNFPTKLSLALAAASWRQLPVFIYACGVSSGWSRQGRALLESAVQRGTIRKVWVRDERSRELWNGLVGRDAGLEAVLARDPGLLAADRYAIAKRQPDGGGPVVGLNLTSPLAVRYHSRHAPSPALLDRWYLDFGRSVLNRGYRLSVFSNGSPEDREYIARLRPRFEALAADGRISFSQPAAPSELTALIAGFKAVAAFRMHTIIAAFSCGVPFLALSWDPKLEAFVRSVSLANWLCTPVSTSASNAVHKLVQAAERGVGADHRTKILGEARLGIENLYDEIVSALG